MPIIGYILALFIGLCLGLLGGGGSILSVPVLRYVFDYSAYDATAYSLFIVGVASIIGTAGYIKDKLVDFKILFSFGLMASISAFFNRKYFLPSLPDEIAQMGTFSITKDRFIMLVFAIAMLLSARFMIRNAKTNEQSQKEKQPFLASILSGVLVGAFTSLVGAGGGFIVVPILVKFYKIPIKKAIGTSLSIITINSLAGFSGQVLTDNSNIDWPFLVLFAGIAAIGILIGVYLTNIISNQKLKAIFGWFVVVMSVFIITKEIFIS